MKTKKPPSPDGSEDSSRISINPATGLPVLGVLDPEQSATRRTETIRTRPPQKPHPLRPVLKVTGGFDAGKPLFLDGDAIEIGRRSNADLVLHDPGISRRHARITREGSNIILEDMRSKNGVFVRGERIARVRLEPNDEIQLGPNVTLTFVVLSEAEIELAHQLYASSVLDPLTQIHNRRYFGERMRSEVAYALRHNTTLSLLALDLDHFKAINDRFGHAAGDEVLRKCAAGLGRVLRAEDLCARIGGEEFAVGLRDIPLAQARVCGERIRMGIESTRIAWDEADGEELSATVSVGVASLDECTPPTLDALLRLADERLYKAKSGGRNKVCSG